ncbi:YhcN/YlaJ family sporulation lipoprotein [Paenibacillus massiliensis]|uniref:YhcN/YlaJ family sporulation lipoprotein n=1 Tax=Paenibacillus massiliensis TaxID=225917 RepID=UPI00041FA7BE|nr:YhcN/YlaJ family sporulation lipoprotein [Paenibacillus massiliensis]
MKVYACIMLLSLVLTACGVSRQEQNIREHSVPNGPAAHPVEDVARLPQEANATEQADHLAKIARRVNGVANANCVVLGNTAIVGIDVDGKLERADVGTIKYSVAEAIHKDPDGLNSLVTADADITQRLSEMAADIRAGHPIQGFGLELADIMGRLIPQMSTDTQISENEPQMNKGKPTTNTGQPYTNKNEKAQ